MDEHVRMIGSVKTLFDSGAGAAFVGGLAVGSLAYAARWPGSQLFGSALIAPRIPGELAMTFDDGPHPRWTPQLLEELARYGIHATFFLIGRYAAAQCALVREMHKAGHVIGDHTWTHPNLSLTSVDKTRNELTRTRDELQQIIGAPVQFFRPPFGARRPATFRVARELGMTPVLWNTMAGDWAATHSEQITLRVARIVERNTRRGYASNVVLHDGGHLSLEANRSASVASAGELIKRFKPICQFVTLDRWM